MIKFPKIGQFHNTVKEIRASACWAGVDEDGVSVFDRTAKAPTLDYVGTVKLHGCVSSSTTVDTLEYGLITIGKIIDEKLDIHVKSLNVETNEISYEHVSELYFLADDGEWFELELEDGTTIEITGNNPVWLPSLNCYRKVDELKEGDVLLLDE